MTQLLRFSPRVLATGFALGILVLAGGLFVPQRSYAAAPVYTINLLTPATGDALQADTISSITWERGEGDAPSVSLFYSEDAGVTWEEIVRNTRNDGSYAWTVAHVQSDEVFVRIASTDLATELAVDVSGPLSVHFYEEDNSEYWEDDGVPQEPVLAEDVDGIVSGDYIQTEGVEHVYAIGEDMTRRPFYDDQAYLTYEDDFSSVVDVSLNTFNKFPIGEPMLPQAGAVLIKTPSVSKVYWAEASDAAPVLHWITSEDIATEMFGTDWSDYVLDVDSTLFTRYDIGEDITVAYAVDLSSMKRVSDLHE